jgi:hypothetical protein
MAPMAFALSIIGFVVGCLQFWREWITRYFRLKVYYSCNRFPTNIAMMIGAGAMIHGGLMNMPVGDVTVCCAFCRKRLPALNGELQAWRSPNGQFFCDEFCADDYDEARFRRRSSASASPMQDVGG